MTLPNYIVNWDEMYKYLIDNLDTISYDSIKDVQGVQKSQGFQHRLDNSSPADKIDLVTWYAPTSMVITAISLGEEDWENGNTWSVTINEEEIMKDIRTLSDGSKTNWKVVQPLNEGDVVRVSKSKGDKLMSGRSWINIEYIDVLDDLYDVRPQPPSIPSLPDYEIPEEGLIIVTSNEISGEPIDNVSYDLLDISGNKIKDFSVGYNGVHTVRARIGNSYEIREVETPAGYLPYHGKKFFLDSEKFMENIIYTRGTT